VTNGWAGIIAAATLAVAATLTPSPPRAQDTTAAPQAGDAAPGVIELIAIPEPRRVTVGARKVTRGEIAISDPIPVTVAPDRPVPIPVPAPPTTTVTIGAAREDPTSPPISEPLELGASIERRSPPDAPSLRDPDAIDVGAQRREPPAAVEINDPFPVDVGAFRIPLPVDEAQAAIAACDFPTIRTELRRLVALSDQLNSAGRGVVAELSRLNRSNTAFQKARENYNEGELEDARTLLNIARGIDCVEREQEIAVVLNKIDRLEAVLAKVDSAVDACTVGAMLSMQDQLAGQDHVLLAERKATLDEISEPASAAATAADQARRTLAQGRLDEARVQLNEADGHVQRLPGPNACQNIRGDIAEQRAEIERLTETVEEIELAVLECRIDEMTALSRSLDGEDHILLVEWREKLDLAYEPASTAADLITGARTAIEQGDLDDAEEQLDRAEARLAQLPDASLCPVLQDEVTVQRTEIERLEGLVVEIDGAIAACAPDQLTGLIASLEDEDHVLVQAGRETLDRIDGAVITARNLIDSAAERFDTGNLAAAERRAGAAEAELAEIAETTECAPIREQIETQRDQIAEVRGHLEAVDERIAFCNAESMRNYATVLEGEDYGLLVDARERLLGLAGPIERAGAAIDQARPHYLAGRLDEAESALGQARAELAEIETCAPLKEQAATGLDKIERMRAVLTRVDGAVASCDLPAMTAMGRQLAGQDHVLLAERAARVASVQVPGLAAENRIRDGNDALSKGDLSTARADYEQAIVRLGEIDAALCPDMREEASRSLQEIDRISATLARADDAIAACDVGAMRATASDLAGEDYVLLVRSRERLDELAGPIATARDAVEDSRPLYERGDLDGAEARLDAAGTALESVPASVCPEIRDDMASIGEQIADVRSLVAQSENAIASCDRSSVTALQERLAGRDHRLLRAMAAELADFFAPVEAARNLGETARELYFGGNLDGAERRLLDAVRELESRPTCTEAIETVERRLDRINRMRTVLVSVDAAVAACNIPAMASMSQQLAPQTHGLLVAKKRELDLVKEPALAAQSLSTDAWPLYQDGQLVAAQRRLEQALRNLDQIDPALCLPLRREVDQRLSETDRIRSTLILADSAIANCNYEDIDLLIANLANAEHVALERALEDLRSGRLRCGLSPAERIAQAQETCERKHPNSIVDEFDPATGRYTCVCPDDYLWDPRDAACEPAGEVMAAANAVCHAGYPNTRAVNLRSPTEFECNCQDGFVWNSDESACVSAAVVMDDAIAFCAREGGYPVEIQSEGRYTCCPDGATWDPGTRTCTTTATSGGGISDPQCQWVRALSHESADGYECTCSPQSLCGPRPEAALPTVSPADSADAADEPDPMVGGDAPPPPPPPATETAPADEDRGLIDRLRDLFGGTF